LDRGHKLFGKPRDGYFFAAFGDIVVAGLVCQFSDALDARRGCASSLIYLFSAEAISPPRWPLDTLLGLDHDRFCARFGAASWIFTVGC
jgi:hypothetical protein